MPKPKGLGIKPVSAFVGDRPNDEHIALVEGGPKPAEIARKNSFELSATGTQFSKDGIEITNKGISSGARLNTSGLADIKIEDLEEICVLGRGASATVKKMRHKPTGQFIALKLIMLNDHGNRSQLINELRSLVGSDTPSLTQLYNAFAMDGAVGIALEYFDIGGVDQLLTKRGRFPEGIAAKITRQMLVGLDHLHTKQKQVHRDLKPANLLIKSDGTAKVSDFGISRTLDATLAMASTFIGTVTYMSPERLAGESYSVTSDIWSVGVIVIEFLTGQNPFPPGGGGGFFQLLNMVRDGDAPTLDPAVFSPEVIDFVKKCLTKNPVTRPRCFTMLAHPWITMHENSEPSLADWLASEAETAPMELSS